MNVDSATEKRHEVSMPLDSRWFWVVLIGLVLILGGGWLLFSRSVVGATITGNNATNLQPAAIAGHPAPDFELRSLDGEVIRLSDFRGQPVIVNFWATWCGPCRAEFPDFQRASVDNADRLVIIGVNHTTTDQVEQVSDFVNEFGVTFPIVLDETGETVEAYNVLGLPTSVFVDAQGIVREVFTGPINKAYIEAKVSEVQ